MEVIVIVRVVASNCFFLSLVFASIIEVVVPKSIPLKRSSSAIGFRNPEVIKANQRGSLYPCRGWLKSKERAIASVIAEVAGIKMVLIGFDVLGSSVLSVFEIISWLALFFVFLIVFFMDSFFSIIKKYIEVVISGKRILVACVLNSFI